ncbi:MAG: site-specific integrase [Chitinophagaceae bacterium]|nr:site-specific integrase [Anaerolineae bacterium]
MTWGLVAGFVRWQMNEGYAVTSINVRLSTVKKYAALAFQAGAIEATEHALIRAVGGYTHKESKQVDEKRTTAGTAIRYNRPGAKKADAVSIPDATAKTLKTGNLNTPQGRRDALLMCLLLDHGLRCGEVALLKVGNFNLADSTMTFYRPKVDKVQTHNLTADTRRALEAWVESGDCPLLAEVPVLRGSTKGGALTTGGMSERAIAKRVAYVGAQHGLTGLSAHDCRHYWATRASSKGTDPFSLQEAGGWNSLAMPRRYVEDAKIANAGVKLD